MILLLIFLLIIGLLLLINNYGIFYNETSTFRAKESEVLLGAESFEYRAGNKKAVMFIHGFPGSPKMYYLARELAIKSGYDVFVPRLPGFGTTHENFIKSNFTIWYNYLVEYYEGIRDDYQEFYVVGNSMGGALTLKLAECSTIKPTAIASVAAPVFLNSLHLRVVINPFIYCLRYIGWVTKYIPSKRPPKDKSLDEDGETDWVGYRGIFPKQIYSLYIGLQKVRKELYKINIPCYLCQAIGDKTVSYKNLEYIKTHLSSSKINSRSMDLSKWKHSNHSMFIYKSIIDDLWSDIDSFFQSL